MAYISVPEGVPGIRSLVMYRPETGQHLYNLAQVLLRGPSPLSEAEREIIATHVSAGNECRFCMESHAAAARELLGKDDHIVDCVISKLDSAPLSSKMKALLNIAGKVRISGKSIKEEDIAQARQHGAGDRDIHDTVLIAAAFSMFNRYVDGLGTYAPSGREEYTAMGKRMVDVGYVLPQKVVG